MARNSKYEKNLEKVQSYLDGTHQGKIQSGFIPEDIHGGRKVGDKWTDSDGKEWEQKEGYSASVHKAPSRGIADKCSTCETYIFKPWDKDTYKADGRCYHCQLNFELDLEFDKPIRWFAYRRLKDFRNMESLHKDMEQFVFEKHEFEKNEKIFDKSVANALANAEIDTTNVKLTNN